MLKALTIENIAVAKNLDIDFAPGFTVLTGKTGAGKSIIMDSLSQILGAKTQRDLIRSGEDNAKITAIFSVTDELTDLSATADENNELTLIRALTSDGRSSVKINYKSAPLAQLREVGSALVSMHGQNETVTLLDKNSYIQILDSYACNSDYVNEYAKYYTALVSKKRELQEFKDSIGDKDVLCEVLKFQIAEIDKAKLNDFEEEEKLERLRTRLKNTEHIVKSANLVSRALAPSDKGASASYLLERAAAALLNLNDALDGAEDMAARLNEYRCDLIDIAERTRELVSDDFDDEPDKQLDKIEARLNLITKLKKKYGFSIEEILTFRNNAALRLKGLDEGEEKIAELERECKQLLKLARESADRLSISRRDASTKMTLEIMDTLKYLDMPKVRFSIEIRAVNDNSDGLNKYGCDDVDFVVATNPGEPKMSLAKIASGGELSRIMLAIKCAQAKKSGTGTVVFDEIDTGVSGGTSERIGIKLKELSEKIQVICITHSPQISSHADTHLLIEKLEVNGRVESNVRVLTHQERINEIARMIGGIDITDTQISAAKEMLIN